ncbi:hypothetical protein [Hymenobacter persicinus]|uniref:Outer membrane protein beta-barrel domain-containing protein n=1 Tax=Hymenobacter persicinus TaxID=2025506 RepID=A0A4Q5LCX9_9BACT|nr:hypothetical protein [Hymenobacter persicinus]RYU81087.1 hypothetical protein EWM57_07550 [Hymenobacter persicinus]
MQYRSFLGATAAVLLLAPSFSAHATSEPDAAPAPAQKRTAAIHPWYRPRHLMVQTGGGIGMVAAGAGYAFAKNKVETDILLGYVPKKYAGSTLSLASAKLLYSPFTVRLADQWQLKPLTVGVYFSYTHGTINDEERGQYTKDYYWFSTDTRYGPLAGSRLTFLRPGSTEAAPKAVSLYYELGTNDLYAVSYAQNRKGLSFGQILTLAIGVKADF